MTEDVQAVVLREGDVPPETWDDDVRGTIRFRTLFSGGTTPTRALTTGVGEVPPGGRFALHHHAAPEVYYVLAGEGVVVVEGVEHRVSAGSTVFIPGDALHAVDNPGPEPLRISYTLAADSLDDVEYHFAAAEG